MTKELSYKQSSPVQESANQTPFVVHGILEERMPGPPLYLYP